jgi:carboxyl-terminal processing protease
VQDYGKGAIIGTQTFGKGIVQTIQPLTDGSAVKFTISQYYTPNGQVIHGKGVTPDEVVELSEDDTEDAQLEAAVNYIKSK